MAWIHKGRKYWYHNGKRYSRRLKRRNNGYFVAPRKKDKHKEAMEYRKVLLKRQRDNWRHSSIHGHSSAIMASDEEILKIKERDLQKKEKQKDNNSFWNF